MYCLLEGGCKVTLQMGMTSERCQEQVIFSDCLHSENFFCHLALASVTTLQGPTEATGSCFERRALV